MLDSIGNKSDKGGQPRTVFLIKTGHILWGSIRPMIDCAATSDLLSRMQAVIKPIALSY